MATPAYTASEHGEDPKLLLAVFMWCHEQGGGLHYPDVSPPFARWGWKKSPSPLRGSGCLSILEHTWSEKILWIWIRWTIAPILLSGPKPGRWNIENQSVLMERFYGRSFHQYCCSGYKQTAGGVNQHKGCNRAQKDKQAPGDESREQMEK